MSAEILAQAHYRRQVVIAQRTAKQVARLWRQVEATRVHGSWVSLLAEVVPLVTAAQTTAAATSGPYVADVLKALGAGNDPTGRIAPARFAGVASDGRPLAGLLEQPALRALGRLAAGDKPARALAAGRLELDMIVRTQVADAGRVADGAAIVAQRHTTGYVRMLSMPSCSRCIILAGRHYAWNAGFRRHPRCDCRHIPSVEDSADDRRTDPRAAFAGMSAAEQDRSFGKAGAQAIRDGADISQVVNARRGMQTANVFGRDVLVTTEGTTSRASAGSRLGARETQTKRAEDRYRRATRVRLMPEQIYLEAGGNRDEATRLLKLHGFLI